MIEVNVQFAPDEIEPLRDNGHALACASLEHQLLTSASPLLQTDDACREFR